MKGGVGLGVGDCYLCAKQTPWRYRGVYVCEAHKADIVRDDPAPLGAKPKSAVVAGGGFTKLSDSAPVALRQVSLPGARVDQEPARRRGVSIVGPIDDDTARELAEAGVAGVAGALGISPRLAAAPPAGDEDPLQLDGWNPATKAWDTPSGAYEGPRVAEAAISPDEF